MQRLDHPHRVRLDDSKVADRINGCVGRNLVDPLVEVALPHSPKDGVDELRARLAADQACELDCLTDRRVRRRPQEDQLVGAEPSDVEHVRIDVAQWPRTTCLEHRIEEAAASKGAVGECGGERRVTTVQVRVGEHLLHREVGVGVVVVDVAEHVVGRKPRRVDGPTVRAPLDRARAVAGHAPSSSLSVSRTPRAQSAATIARLPAGRTSPSRTA